MYHKKIPGMQSQSMSALSHSCSEIISADQHCSDYDLAL